MSQEILKYKIKAKKSLGQNFLVDKNILDQISDILDVNGKNIVEIGPGYGALTEKLLLKKPKNLTLVELDLEMINILEQRIKNEELKINNIDFEIKNEDVLKFKPIFTNYSVIANIPYYITSPILRHFLYDLENKPDNMVILMQKDVSDRILSGQENGKGKLKSSVLSLIIAKKCRVSEKIFVPKESFVPSPKVESSVLLFESHNLYNNIDDDKFLEIIKVGFGEPRKKLIKNLLKLSLKKEDIIKIFFDLSLDENVRGESLDIKIWCELIKSLNV